MRRTAIVILLCLLAGVVIQVGVAWVAAWRTPNVRPVANNGVRLEGISGRNWLPPRGWWMASGRSWSWHTTIWINDKVLDPKSGADVSGLDFTSPICTEHFGFPFRGLQAGYPVKTSGNQRPQPSTWIGGVEVPTRLLPAGVSYKRLPIRPVWPGFALNTIFYAVVAFLVSRGLIALRRHHRRRAGRCPRCSYSLKGLAPTTPCPECGTAPPSSPPPAQPTPT